jgi:hypothetical protein
MAAAVMGDAAISVGNQKEHLVFPGVCAQRPAMAEDCGLSAAPVLVIDLRSVFGRDRGHRILLSDARSTIELKYLLVRESVVKVCVGNLRGLLIAERIPRPILFFKAKAAS